MNKFKLKDFIKRIIELLILLSMFGTISAQTKSIDERAEDVVSKLTLNEKIGLIVGDGKYLPRANIKSDKKNEVPIADRTSNMIIPRLSIKATSLTDGPAGINKSPPPEGKFFNTAFPTSTCLAATWNTELVEKVGRAYGEELLDYGYDLVLMPALNLHRNPNCGRNFEYFSEDPLLTGKMTSSIVNGVQSYGVGTTLKHFVANNQESNRRKYNAVISQRALREIYLRGFEMAVRESRPAAIMTSYNKVNGYYNAERTELLQDVVRKEWGFKGLYMTDFDMNYGDAVAQVRAGVNMIMSGNQREFNELSYAIKNKILSEETLDRNLLYNIKLKLHSPSMKGYKPSFEPDLIAHATVARDAAAEGMVLLKNDNNALPLNITTEKRIALFGKISYHLIMFGTGSGGVRSYNHNVTINNGLKKAGFLIPMDMEKYYKLYIEKIKSENLVPPYFDTPKHRKDNGIKGNQAPPHFKNRLVAFSKEKDVSIEEIKDYETRTDVAFITIGRSAGENYENGFLPITKIELNLLHNVSSVFHASGKKVIVILNVGGVWETASWRDYVDAILLAWQPGQEGGYAVADIVTGKVNPSGKLPDSFPLKYEDVPSAETFPGKPVDAPINSFYNEGIYVGYRYYDSFNIPTAYEFGYGLSYTTFKFSDLQLSSNTFSSTMKINVTVKNTGRTAGKEVVQLYLSAPTTEIEKPIQELKGFTKSKLLQPGESQKLLFELDERSLSSFWSGKSAWVADKGDYEVRIGASSKDIRLKAKFKLPKDKIVEKVHDVLYPNIKIKEISRFN